MSTIPNLTETTNIAFTVKNVRNGFVANSQIDPLTISIPSLIDMVHTNRGCIQGICLEDGQKLAKTFFDDMHTNGCISEDSYDNHKISKDWNSKGNVVGRPTEIHMENRHRAKILLSDKQICERGHFLDTKRMREYMSQGLYYAIDDKEYGLNLHCEKSLLP